MKIVFDTWKTIQVDYSKGLKEYLKEIEDAQVTLTGELKPEVLNHIPFQKESRTSAVSLVMISISDLRKYGIDIFNTNYCLFKYFFDCGLRKCDIQTALQLGIFLRQEKENELVKVVTDLLSISGVNFQIVQIKHDNKYYLGMVSIDSFGTNFFIPTHLIFRKN